MILGPQAIAAALSDLSARIVNHFASVERIGVVAVRRGGLALSELLAKRLSERRAHPVPTGSVDVAFYRDDVATARPDPKVGPSHVPFDVNKLDLILVDDVLHTGRTIRAAIDAVMDYGRPRRIWLAVLCDRGGRELPINADFAGCTVAVPDNKMLKLEMQPGNERAWLISKGVAG